MEERKLAVLELLSGKATVDQIARRLGVLPSTVEGWRTEAVEGIETALRRGTARSAQELQLERENAQLRDALAEQAIKTALLERALTVERQGRPTGPARSRR